MRLYPHPPRLYTIHFTLYTKKQIFEFMKKSYIAPQTEAIELLGANAIMIGSRFIEEGDPVGGVGGL